MERKGGAIQLSCRALEDLTTLDEAKVKACDDLYDRLKAKARAPEMGWKNRKEVNVSEKGSPKEDIKHFILKLDADSIRLSQLLLLKDLFRAHPGKSTIDLQFFSEEHRCGVVSIDSQWGVKATSAFLDELKVYQFVSLT